MKWSLELSTAPLQEPLTLEEVRDHLNITTSDDDSYLDALILSVRQAIEEEASLALLTQTRKLRLDEWPVSARVYLPRPPLQSISSVAYLDSDGANQTLASSVYQIVGVRSTPPSEAPPVAYLTPAYGESWPSLRSIPESVTITYVCGWTARGLIPQPIRHAMLVLASEMYEEREIAVRPEALAGIGHLLANYRANHDFGEDCG